MVSMDSASRGPALIPGVTLVSVVPTISQPSLETEDLILRPFDRSDVDELIYVNGEIRVSGMTRTIPHPYTAADAQRFIEVCATAWDAGTGPRYAITVRSSGRLIGSCGCTVDAIDLRAELGYAIHPDFWGHGYASQAARAVTACVFTHLPLRKLCAHYLAHNVASGRVLEKLGFVKEGLLRGQAYKHGIEYDLVALGLLRSEWRG